MRLGLAACFFRAGQMDLAQAAYDRVLELEPSNADALLGLATLHLNSSSVQQVGWWCARACHVCVLTGNRSSRCRCRCMPPPPPNPHLTCAINPPSRPTPPLFNQQKGLSSGMELLGRAFKADPGHPGVLASLGHFLLLQVRGRAFGGVAGGALSRGRRLGVAGSSWFCLEVYTPHVYTTQPQTTHSQHTHAQPRQGHPARALQLADAALLAADTDALRAFGTCLRARAAHALGRLAEAERGYAVVGCG